MTTATSLAPLLERFFTQRLMHQRQASPHTISSYRDTFRQFLIFAQQRLHQPPSRLTVEQIDAPLIVAFLDELEKQRGLTIRSRNLRLTAIHSFFRYAAFELPTHAAQILKSACHPQQALRAYLGQLFQPSGSRCVTRRTRLQYLVRAARPCVHADGSTDGFAFIRDDRTQTRGPYLGSRRSRTGNRQGPQGTLYSPGKIDTRRIKSLAARTTTR